ncbi:MAG: hypothetical protein EOP40_17285 [Rubrivivax sp.]|nr:MAG: hypothetical protein EOP40_17285 [Rubrivivax sp.]
MKPPVFTRLVALVAWFGLLLQAALTLRLVLSQGGTVMGALVIYAGYFTVLTNLLVAVSLSVPTRWFRSAGVATCVAVSIALVGLAYHLLLRHVWNPQGLQWVADVTLHYVTPLLCLLHWWWVVPPARHAWHAPVVWAAWPVAYLAYALLRGHWLQSYPYPFIDVNVLGYRQSLLNALGLLVVFLCLGLAFVAVARARLRRAAR